MLLRTSENTLYMVENGTKVHIVGINLGTNKITQSETFAQSSTYCNSNSLIHIGINSLTCMPKRYLNGLGSINYLILSTSPKINSVFTNSSYNILNIFRGSLDTITYLAIPSGTSQPRVGFSHRTYHVGNSSELNFYEEPNAIYEYAFYMRSDRYSVIKKDLITTNKCYA